ncbi:unnamed protein product [Rotaria socialis]|uniref:Uncharacterized protein n=1 Tax=Rotaria socialis TaxID=392032 RepID=A0A820LVS1_9BILA|nr:unnamed protein product [Rotaria socialis]CAF4363606.1 unnamed protein product [Rotaria socialis]
MIQACREYYDGNTNEMKFIDDFEKNYRSEDAIVWYLKRSFVYKLITKALRTRDMDLLCMFRFFIDDLTENFRHEHEKLLSSKEKMLNAYRRVKLSKEEFDELKENQTKLIFTNGYFSTSMSKEFALNFALRTTKNNDDVSVLFHIQCNIEQIHENVLFANVNQLSGQQDHLVVLFDSNACFQIESIEKHAALYIIKMNLSTQGQQITKNFIELILNETEEMSISIILGRLFYDLYEYDKSQKYFQRLLNDSNDEDRARIEFSIGKIRHMKDEWDQAREYYDRTYEHMIKTKPARMKGAAQVLQNIGSLLVRQTKYDEALNCNLRALTIRQILHPAGDVDTAASLRKMGDILVKQLKYTEAMDYYQQTLKMSEKFYSAGHVNIAVILNQISDLLLQQDKYDEATDYCQRALKIRGKLYPSDHPNMAISLINIGMILECQRKYDEAMGYYQQALKIIEKFYPSGHTDTVLTLNRIGYVFSQQKEYDESMDYYQRALKMMEKFYPFDHAYTAVTLNKIGCISLDQKKYDKAMDYFQRH